MKRPKSTRKGEAGKGPHDRYPHGKSEHGEAVADYVYKDQHSEPYLLVVKYIQTDGRKSFPQYHWEEGDKLKTRGDWFKGAPKGPKIPYLLPKLVEASPEEPVFITEGEKDADTLSYDNGLLATTNSEGAGKWTDDLNRWFEGRKTVYVLEDNDAPGRKHAVKVARNLVDIVGEVRIVRFPDVPEGEDVTYWLKELGHTKDQLLERAAAAKLYEKRTRILIRGGDTPGTLKDIEEAMIAAEVPILRRAGKLVEPIWDKMKGKDGRDYKVTRLVYPTWRTLAELLSKHAIECYKIDRRHREEIQIPIDPPSHLMLTLLERHHGTAPPVIGIINSPTMRRNGSLITESGYDEETQIWYQPAEDHFTLPEISEHPTRADAAAALERIKELVEESHFVSALDRAVAIAAIMTAVLRGAFFNAPMYLFFKPEPGTGASYLANIIATLATGHDAVPLATNDDPREFHKELSAAAIQAWPILNLNNLTVDLKSTLLSQMVTEVEFELRLFGKNNETVRCNCSAMTILANGNNIQVVGELVRRTLTCRLNAKTERPELWSFKKRPLEMIKANRGGYLADIFTIARAYDGSVKDKVNMINHLDEWSKRVQQPLVWLGEEDPVKSMEGARKRDPERRAFQERLAALAKHFPDGKPFTAAKVYEKADTKSHNGYSNPDLVNAFTDKDGRLRSARSIGQKLTGDEERRWGDCYIQIVEEDDKTSNTYRVVGSPPAAEPKPADEPNKDMEEM